ncbi:hypothetical protein LPMP_204490 [Leishmania panamensis]|uniref:Uncharacterized protein n=1 Tax=Leishmania panamensis TaxID=5679 RepID=A0A088RPB4_LEIPA|nr:hypothetical protein LPMP_204490 [Leishmania panamensis]AIN97942.1 hypothetical protein LPMP_204490 [Leishmania panamensis]
MNRASKILWMATLSRAAAEDGQDSMRKLALLPLTFLSLSGNTSYLASILASAVGFLEGYSVSDLEADINFVKTPSGDFVAHTQLNLVPYTRWKAPTLVSSTPVVDTLPSTSTKTLVASHRLSISHVIADEVPHTFSAEEVSQLQRFKDSFKGSASAVDYVANDLLRTTDSVKVAKVVLRFSAQVGLTIPRSTLQELVQRLKPEEAFFASRICQEFAFEVNLERLHRSSLICSQRVLHLVDSPRRKREESKLERLRRTTSPR